MTRLTSRRRFRSRARSRAHFRARAWAWVRLCVRKWQSRVHCRRVKRILEGKFCSAGQSHFSHRALSSGLTASQPHGRWSLFQSRSMLSFERGPRHLEKKIRISCLGVALRERVVWLAVAQESTQARALQWSNKDQKYRRKDSQQETGNSQQKTTLSKIFFSFSKITARIVRQDVNFKMICIYTSLSRK